MLQRHHRHPQGRDDHPQELRGWRGRRPQPAQAGKVGAGGRASASVCESICAVHVRACCCAPRATCSPAPLQGTTGRHPGSPGRSACVPPVRPLPTAPSTAPPTYISLWSPLVPLLQAGIQFTGDDCVLSYLPLAHSFDRIIEELALCVGGHIGYWRVRLIHHMACMVTKTFALLVCPRSVDEGYWRASRQRAAACAVRAARRLPAPPGKKGPCWRAARRRSSHSLARPPLHFDTPTEPPCLHPTLPPLLPVLSNALHLPCIVLHLSAPPCSGQRQAADGRRDGAAPHPLHRRPPHPGASGGRRCGSPPALHPNPLVPVPSRGSTRRARPVVRLPRCCPQHVASTACQPSLRALNTLPQLPANPPSVPSTRCLNCPPTLPPCPRRVASTVCPPPPPPPPVPAQCGAS